jgi:hypothetical protein
VSASSLVAPALARSSLPSLPSSPLWPFTHWKYVGAVLFLSRYETGRQD